MMRRSAIQVEVTGGGRAQEGGELAAREDQGCWARGSGIQPVWPASQGQVGSGELKMAS